MRLKQEGRFNSLQGKLKSALLSLHSNIPPCIMLAMPTMQEFLRQKLPAYRKVTPYSLSGTRIIVHGHHRFDQAVGTYAYWPEDHLKEYVRSMITIVHSGNPVLRVADYQIHAQAGDILFTPRYIPRWDDMLSLDKNVTADSNPVLILILGAIEYPPYLSIRICRHDNEYALPLIEGEGCWSDNYLMGQMFNGIENYLQQKGREKSALHLLASLITLFQEDIEEGYALDSKNFPSNSPLVNRLEPIERAKIYMKNHIERRLSIDFVARCVWMSRSTFTREFHLQTGQTFIEYLTDLRLEQSKVLLTKTTLPIVRISEKVGLKPGRLREIFQQKEQCTPAEYRVLHRKG